MTHNLDATVFVYRHRETGTITALYSNDACAMNYRPDYEHVATLEPRMWIQAHYDDARTEREACAQVAEEWLGPVRDRELHIAAAIRSRGNP